MSEIKIEEQQAEETRTSNRREEFRLYLEQKGVMDTLTRAISQLYMEKEKPEDPIDYVKSYMTDHKRPEGDVSVLRADLKAAKVNLKAKEQEVNDLKARLNKYEEVDEPFSKSSPANNNAN